MSNVLLESIPVFFKELYTSTLPSLALAPRLIEELVALDTADSKTRALNISISDVSNPAIVLVAQSVAAAGIPSCLTTLAAAIIVFAATLLTAVFVTWSVTLGKLGTLSQSDPTVNPTTAPLALATSTASLYCCWVILPDCKSLSKVLAVVSAASFAVPPTASRTPYAQSAVFPAAFPLCITTERSFAVGPVRPHSISSWAPSLTIVFAR